MSVQKVLEQIMAQYVEARLSSKWSKRNNLEPLLTQVGEDLFRDSALDELKVSTGHSGNWTHTPWISFLDHQETTDMYNGVYVVFLFREDMSGVYLTLAQGITGPKGQYANWRVYLTEKGRWVREAVGDELSQNGFQFGRPDLRTNQQRGKAYEQSVIAHKLYARGAVPSDQELHGDFKALIKAYKEYVLSHSQTIHRELNTLMSSKNVADQTKTTLSTGRPLDRNLSAPSQNVIEPSVRYFIFAVDRDKPEFWSIAKRAGIWGITRMNEAARSVSAGDCFLVYQATQGFIAHGVFRGPFEELKDGETDPWTKRRDFPHIVGIKVVKEYDTPAWYKWHANYNEELQINTFAVRGFSKFTPEGFQKVLARLNDLNREAAKAAGEFNESDQVVDLHPAWDSVEAGGRDALGLFGLGQVLRRVLSALQSGKNVILIGPPGTGKTELAERLCAALHVKFQVATATSDWTNVDTIGGYMPDPRLGSTNRHDPLNYFRGLIVDAMETRTWLVIDELNRADIDKAFGEMFTVLSGKPVHLPFFKRSGEQLLKVILGASSPSVGTYSVPVPADWRLIGTMNTFDKSSLYELSYAFMRRFAFIPVQIPEPEIYRDLLEGFPGWECSGEREALLKSQCLSLVKDIFAPTPGKGLAKMDLLVGPAIALDVLKYLSTRSKMASRLGENISASNLVLEAIESYLYPQYEGKADQHSEILDSLAVPLQLSTSQKNETGRLLASYTGHEEGLGA